MKDKLKFAIMVLVAVMVVMSCKKSKDDDTAPSPTPSSPSACSPDTVFNPTGTGPRLIFKFRFDSTQVRLDNLGNPSTIPSGHAAQSPKFNLMSQHYIELAGDLDPVGGGKVLYLGTQTTAGGATAIDYCSSVQSHEGATFYSVPLSSITPGSYKWLRVSLAYQNYDITYKSVYLPGSGLGTGIVASFIGYRTYVNSFKINGKTYSPSTAAGGPGNHDQGYWAFLTSIAGSDYFYDGQAPAGATTVPNPLFATSPIPAGSCLVTGQFVDSGMSNSPLVITGTETTDIIITVSLSTNKSFEWIDSTPDGYYQPENGEVVTDMGIRGMIPIKN